MSNALNLRLARARQQRRWREQAELDEDQEWAQFTETLHQMAADLDAEQNAKRRPM